MVFKKELFKLALAKGYAHQQGVNLLLFIDLMLILPEKLELEYNKTKTMNADGTVDKDLLRSGFFNALMKEATGESYRELYDKFMEVRFSIAKKLLKDGMSVLKVSELVEISIEKTQKIQANLD